MQQRRPISLDGCRSGAGGQQPGHRRAVTRAHGVAQCRIVGRRRTRHARDRRAQCHGQYRPSTPAHRVTAPDYECSGAEIHLENRDSPGRPPNPRVGVGQKAPLHSWRCAGYSAPASGPRRRMTVMPCGATEKGRMTHRLTVLSGLAMGVALAWSLAPAAQSQTRTAAGEWRDYGGDKGFTKYSPLDQITKDNVGQLRIAWRRPAVDETLRARNPGLTIANNLRSTPLMVGGVLYASNGIGLVEAFDPATGKTIWVQESDGELRGGAPTRGIAYWGSGDEARILAVRGQYLSAIDPKTGKLIRTLRHERPGGPASRHGPAAEEFLIRQRSANLQRRRPHRRGHDRRAVEQGRATREGAGLRRSDGSATVAVQSDSPSRRSRQRHLGERLVVVQRRGQHLVVHVQRRTTRAGLPADRCTDQRHVRRPPAW